MAFLGCWNYVVFVIKLYRSEVHYYSSEEFTGIFHSGSENLFYKLLE